MNFDRARSAEIALGISAALEVFAKKILGSTFRTGFGFSHPFNCTLVAEIWHIGFDAALVHTQSR